MLTRFDRAAPVVARRLARRFSSPLLSFYLLCNFICRVLTKDSPPNNICQGVVFVQRSCEVISTARFLHRPKCIKVCEYFCHRHLCARFPARRSCPDSSQRLMHTHVCDGSACNNTHYVLIKRLFQKLQPHARVHLV